jgi:hypothetical protein
MPGTAMCQMFPVRLSMWSSWISVVGRPAMRSEWEKSTSDTVDAELLYNAKLRAPCICVMFFRLEVGQPP